MFSEHTGVPRTRRYTIDVDSLIDENTVVFFCRQTLTFKTQSGRNNSNNFFLLLLLYRLTTVHSYYSVERQTGRHISDTGSTAFASIEEKKGEEVFDDNMGDSFTLIRTHLDRHGLRRNFLVRQP